LRVRELVALVDQPQNLISYHLRLLREAGLVTAARSSFDARHSYYHLDLDYCALALAATGTALHPALNPDPTTPAGLAHLPRPPHITLLFVCTGNSARSPIAEALLRRHTAGQVAAVSAGSHPKPRLHPNTVRVLREHFGIDIADQRPRRLDNVSRDRSQALSLGRAQAAVADDDEVRRVRADRVEKNLRRVPGDEPLVDVSHSLPGETGDRLLSRAVRATSAPYRSRWEPSTGLTRCGGRPRGTP
jgi:protein-tyrosine-phosphatase